MQNSNTLANCEQIIVQFHPHNNQTLIKFKNNLIANDIAVRQQILDLPNRINIYSGTFESSPSFSEYEYALAVDESVSIDQDSKNKNKNTLIVSIIYQQQNNQILEQIPKIRTILLRECLPQLINFHYQIQPTLNQMETLKHLTNFVSTLVSVQYGRQISYFDQKLSKFVSTNQNANKKDPREVWKNMLYQIHGMENGKVELIAEKFPTLESLYWDLGGPRTIQNITSLNNVNQEKKIRKATIKKLQKIFLSINANEELEDLNLCSQYQ